MSNSYRELIRDEVRELPFYVPGKPIEELRRERGLTNVVKLASNENSWGTDPAALDAIIKFLPDIFRYPDSKAYDLRLTIAASLGLKTEQFVFGNGSEEIIKLIALAFFRAGDEILMGKPTFPRYSSVSKMMGATPIELPCNNGYYPLERILDCITIHTRAVFICNPNNPTGTVLEEERLREFVSRVPKNVLLIFDEAYYEFMEIPFSGLLFLEEHPVIVLRTFSKAFGLAGLRIGFAISSSELIDGMERVREAFNVNALVQVAALAAWKNREYLQQIIAANAVERRYLTNELEGMGAKTFPSQTNFVMAFFPGMGTRLSEQLLDKGIIIRPGCGFGYPDGLRITVGTREENSMLLTALRNIITNKVT
ncbi:MAG: histidinol-phosphate transaminase [Desulfitobacteriaceae bacterium]